MLKVRTLFLTIVLLAAACSRATATPTPPAATAPEPNNTLVSPTLLPTLPPIQPSTQPSTLIVGGASATAAAPVTAPPVTPAGPTADRAEFVADLTIPDGAAFGPGATFTKSWRVKNVGASTWNKDYVLQFALGANLAAVNKINLPGDVTPGATVDLSVDMTAPADPGVYSSLWQFVSPTGVKFGVGPSFNEAIYAQINVVAGLPVSAPGASTTVPTASGPLNPVKVAKVTLTVDNANFTGDCPHTFVFTAVMNIEGGGAVKYQLEASAATEGFQFQLPSALESVFNTNGPHTFGASFTLDMRDTVQGQAWLHVLSPNDLVSDKVAFSLTCPARPTRTPLFVATSAASAASATPKP